MDIQTLSNLDVYPGNWKFKKDGSTFKEKCFDLLLRRACLDGNSNLKLVVPSKMGQTFETFMCESLLKTFKYTNICVYDSNLDSMNQLFPDVDPASVYLASYLMNDCISEESESLDSIVDGILEELPNYDYEFGDVYLDKEDILDAIKGFNLATKGEYKKALEYSIVEELANGFADAFVDANHGDKLLTPMQAVQCFEIFGDMFQMSENFSAKIHVIKSKEIYSYRYEYYENVPEKIRQEVDSLIKVISCPIDPEQEGCCQMANIWDPEDKSFLVVLELLEQSYDLSPLFDGDLNGMLKSAVLTLDSLLPALKCKYGQKAA